MKFKPKSNKRTLLSDKIADALTVKPRADIEDDHVFGTKPKTLSRADFSGSDSEDEAAISDFRKRNVNLLSEINKKYEGQVVSRNDLEKSHSEDNASDSDSEAEIGGAPLQNGSKAYTEDDSEESDLSEQLDSIDKSHKQASDSEDFDSEGESDDYSITRFQKSTAEESEDDEEDDEGEGYDISQMEAPMKETFEHVKKQNVSEEAKKGACVRNQLLLWEGLLEMRIHLQRCMNTANQMPFPEESKELKANQDFSEECAATKANVSNVLDKFLSLRSLLFKNFPETKAFGVKKSDAKQQESNESKPESDEEIPSDTDNEEIPSDTDDEDAEVNVPKPVNNNTKQETRKRKLEEYENEISTSHKSFKTFRDTTIQKWNEKTRIAVAANMKNTPTNTILQQISYLLSDRDKLVRRTQLKRSEYDIIGYKKQIPEEKVESREVTQMIKDRKDNDEYIPEIFDDSDFYHQLLRELIECKSADISDPVQLSRQWIALQQMRSKMKRKVDTKATKGRKIKYVVHNKLVNFMASEKCTSWTDESTSELYSSLFGKMYESNNIGVNVNLENGFKIK